MLGCMPFHRLPQRLTQALARGRAPRHGQAQAQAGAAARPTVPTPPRGARPGAGTALALFALLLVVAGCWFLRRYFGALTPQQLLVHLQHGGLGQADPALAWRAARYLAGTLLGLAVLVLLWVRLGRQARRALWVALSLGAVWSVGATLHDPCEPGQPDLLDQAYVDPGRVQVQAPPAAQRPDVLIVFIESLDEAYAHPRPGVAPLLPQLTAWRQPPGQPARQLGGLQMLDGAHWTMGGLFAALCGLHLQPVGLVSRGDYAHAGPFFTGGTCLTDLLAAQGWQLSFHGGASLAFAGKGHFLSAHGVGRRFGRDDWAARGLAMPARGWGLLDSRLAAEVWQDMVQQAGPHGARRPPQAHLVLTVNTHAPFGAADSGCAADGRDADADDESATLRAALRCTDAAVAQLVQRFMQADTGRPRLVWLMGDHVTPRPLLADELQAVLGPQGLFHAVARVDAQGREQPLALATADRRFAHVDVLPTLAQALGLRWSPQPQRLGLGVSLLAAGAPATLLEQMGADRLARRLACPSPRFQQLWAGKA